MPERIYKEWKQYNKQEGISFFGFVKMALKNNLWFWHPAKQLNFIGITGTNGKISTALLIESIFNSAQIFTETKISYLFDCPSDSSNCVAHQAQR